MVRTRVGYAGGTKESPTYRSLGDHTETIQIDYDPERVTYEDLLEVFWREHNPFAPAYGRQYMAAVFYHDEEQRRAAEAGRDRIAARSEREVATKILPAGTFWQAEDYHQKYALRQTADVMREFRRIYPEGDGFTDSTAAARANGWLGGCGTPEDVERDLPRMGLSETAGRTLRVYVGGAR